MTRFTFRPPTAAGRPAPSAHPEPAAAAAAAAHAGEGQPDPFAFRGDERDAPADPRARGWYLAPPASPSVGRGPPVWAAPRRSTTQHDDDDDDELRRLQRKPTAQRPVALALSRRRGPAFVAVARPTRRRASHDEPADGDSSDGEDEQVVLEVDRGAGSRRSGFGARACELLSSHVRADHLDAPLLLAGDRFLERRGSDDDSSSEEDDDSSITLSIDALSLAVARGVRRPVAAGRAAEEEEEDEAAEAAAEAAAAGGMAAEEEAAEEEAAEMDDESPATPPTQQPPSDDQHQQEPPSTSSSDMELEVPPTPRVEVTPIAGGAHSKPNSWRLSR